MLTTKQILIVVALLLIAAIVGFEVWQRLQPDPTAKQLNDLANQGQERLCKLDPKECQH